MMNKKVQTEKAEPTRGSGVRHTVFGVALFAIACSLFVHSLFTYIAAKTQFGTPMLDAGSAAVEVELAEIVREQLEPLSSTELRIAEPSLEPIPEPEITEIDFGLPIQESDLAALDVSDLGDLGTAGNAAEGISSATLSGSSASFFGVEARGSRFIYIIDTSGSMVSGRLEALKIALSDSITSLVGHAKFSVVRYSHTSESLSGKKWWQGSKTGKSIAIRKINSISAVGGTEPTAAFEIAFSFNPPPDAIYFMTDGQFGPQVESKLIGTIKRLMRQREVRPTIHTISFIDKDSERILRQIARMTGGTYTHVAGQAP